MQNRPKQDRPGIGIPKPVPKLEVKAFPEVNRQRKAGFPSAAFAGCDLPAGF